MNSDFNRTPQRLAATLSRRLRYRHFFPETGGVRA